MAYGQAAFGAGLARAGANINQQLFQLALAQQQRQAQIAAAQQKAKQEKLQSIIAVLPHLEKMPPEVVAGLVVAMQDLGIDVGDIDIKDMRRKAELAPMRKEYMELNTLASNKDAPDYIRLQAAQRARHMAAKYPELGYQSAESLGASDTRDSVLAQFPMGEDKWRQVFYHEIRNTTKALMAANPDMNPDEASEIAYRQVSARIPKVGTRAPIEGPENRILKLAQAQEAMAKAASEAGGPKDVRTQYTKLNNEIAGHQAAVDSFSKRLKWLGDYSQSKDRTKFLALIKTSQDPDMLEFASDLESNFRANNDDLSVLVTGYTTNLHGARTKLVSLTAERVSLLHQYPQLAGEEPRSVPVPAPGRRPIPALPNPLGRDTEPVVETSRPAPAQPARPAPTPQPQQPRQPQVQPVVKPAAPPAPSYTREQGGIGLPGFKGRRPQSIITPKTPKPVTFGGLKDLGAYIDRSQGREWQYDPRTRTIRNVRTGEVRR